MFRKGVCSPLRKKEFFMKKIILIFLTFSTFLFSAFCAKEDWTGEMSFNLSFPITNNDLSIDVDGTTGKDSLDTNGVGFLFGGRSYHKDNGLCFLVETGISYAKSSVAGFDDDFSGVLFNMNLGLGKRFGFSKDKGSFIPAFIIGYHGAFLGNSYKYRGYSFDVDVTGYVFEIGGNLYASYLLGEKAGLCASLDLTFNLAGFGTEEVSHGDNSKKYSVDVDGGTVNILPAIGFFIKL